MTVVERIDSIIQARKLSRRQLAIKAGIPPSSLQSAMERGKNLSLGMIEKIAKALDVKIDELLGLSSLPNEKMFISEEYPEFIIDSDTLEISAFIKFLNDVGYKIYIDSTRLSNPKGVDGDVWIIEDRRNNCFFSATVKDLTKLQDVVMSFFKYQIYELTQHLKRIDKEEVNNYKPPKKPDEEQ